MDPLAHTLVGATLAETGLKRTTRLATPALVLGANLPDIDGVAMMLGRDAALLWRRGWTHGVLALVVLPALLTGGMLLFDRWRRRRRPDLAPARAGPLLGLAYLAVLTHPLLDWLNTYGVRLLMPFDGRWFYGDALFIVDPWMWLLMGAAVVLARSQSRLGAGAWIALGAASSALVLGVDRVPAAARAAWIGGVALIAVARWRGWFTGRLHRLALGCAVALVVYIGAMLLGSMTAREAVVAQVLGEGHEVTGVMAGPVAANPLARQGVVATRTHYRLFAMSPAGLRVEGPGVPIEAPTPVVTAALAAVPGFGNWVRFPHAEVEALPDGGHRVVFRDLRYVAPGQTSRGIGMAVVELGPDLEPR